MHTVYKMIKHIYLHRNIISFLEWDESVTDKNSFILILVFFFSENIGYFTFTGHFRHYILTLIQVQVMSNYYNNLKLLKCCSIALFWVLSILFHVNVSNSAAVVSLTCKYLLSDLRSFTGRALPKRKSSKDKTLPQNTRVHTMFSTDSSRQRIRQFTERQTRKVRMQIMNEWRRDFFGNRIITWLNPFNSKPPLFL